MPSVIEISMSVIVAMTNVLLCKMKGYGCKLPFGPHGSITCIAGQPAAAFGACGQGGAIPTAAERLDQEDGTGHPAAENIDCGHFVSEGCTLCCGHFQITRYAASITSEGQLQIFLGSENCTLLCVCFLFENTKCRQVVFDLLKTSQDCFAVVGDGLVVGSDGLIRVGPATTRVKDGRNRRRANRPEDARARQQRGDYTAFETARSAQTDVRIISRLGYADLRVGGGHASFRCRNVGPAFEEFRRKFQRDGRRRRSKRKRRKMKRRCRLSNQCGNAMVELRPEHSDIDGLGTRGLKLRAGLLDFHFGGESSLEAAIRQWKCLLVLRDGGVQELLLRIQAARLEVEQRELRMQA